MHRNFLTFKLALELATTQISPIFTFNASSNGFNAIIALPHRPIKRSRAHEQKFAGFQVKFVVVGQKNARVIAISLKNSPLLHHFNLQFTARHLPTHDSTKIELKFPLGFAIGETLSIIGRFVDFSIYFDFLTHHSWWRCTPIRSSYALIQFYAHDKKSSLPACNVRWKSSELSAARRRRRHKNTKKNVGKVGNVARPGKISRSSCTNQRRQHW